ncbi:hypothetical protein ACIQNG_30155 [Streptomyces sp. NPDC091377]|uniref:hypothetical protein n=1 Tax=Streptomyces sp. NPDC091377 TaxID=3365995 RepID=UPI00380A8100
MFRASALTMAVVSTAVAGPLIGSHSTANATTTSSRLVVVHAEPSAAPNEIFALKNKEANECLDSAAALFMYSCNKSRVQKWGFTNAGGGKVSLYSQEEGKCVTGGFRFVDCGNRDVATFTLEDVKLNYDFIKIRNTANGKCLSADWTAYMERWGLTDGKCSSSHRQLWIKQ